MIVACISSKLVSSTLGKTAMHSSLPAVVVRSLREASREPLLPESSIQIWGEKATPSSSWLTKWARQKLPLIPWFTEDTNGNLATPLKSVFGIFALRAICRGFYIGASFLPGANILLPERHLALAVIGYYTAALHLVNAFNALEGRVFITPVAGQPLVKLPEEVAPVKLAQGGTILSQGSAGYAPSPKGLQAVCAILTRSGDWIFEGRSRSHPANWRELKQWAVETHTIPKWLEEFSRGCVYPPLDKSRYIDEGFEQLIDARHQAVYTGFGMDDWAFDQIINRDDVHANVAVRAQNYKEFAYGILEDVLRGTTDLFAHIESHCPEELNKLLLNIRIMVYTPPFDLGKGILDTLDEIVNRTPSCGLWIYKILGIKD